eukprot:RCo016594
MVGNTGDAERVLKKWLNGRSVQKLSSLASARSGSSTDEDDAVQAPRRLDQAVIQSVLSTLCSFSPSSLRTLLMPGALPPARAPGGFNSQRMLSRIGNVQPRPAPSAEGEAPLKKLRLPTITVQRPAEPQPKIIIRPKVKETLPAQPTPPSSCSASSALPGPPAQRSPPPSPLPSRSSSDILALENTKAESPVFSGSFGVTEPSAEGCAAATVVQEGERGSRPSWAGTFWERLTAVSVAVVGVQWRKLRCEAKVVVVRRVGENPPGPLRKIFLVESWLHTSIVAGQCVHLLDGTWMSPCEGPLLLNEADVPDKADLAQWPSCVVDSGWQDEEAGRGAERPRAAVVVLPDHLVTATALSTCTT